MAPSPSTFLQDSSTRGQYPCAKTPAYHQSLSFIHIRSLVPSPSLTPYLNLSNFSLLKPFHIFFSLLLFPPYFPPLFISTQLTSPSNIRQIPDHQEVYLDNSGYTSIVFEILQRVEKPDEEALQYHFHDLVRDTGDSTNVLEQGTGVLGRMR